VFRSGYSCALVGAFRGQLARPVGINGLISSTLTVLCVALIRFVTARDYWASSLVYFAGGLLPIGFLWCLGSTLFGRRKDRLVPLGAIVFSLVLAPWQVVYGLMFLPMYLMGGK
jgi:hypothetical protein